MRLTISEYTEINLPFQQCLTALIGQYRENIEWESIFWLRNNSYRTVLQVTNVLRLAIELNRKNVCVLGIELANLLPPVRPSQPVPT
jgi:hypothetical protein